MPNPERLARRLARQADTASARFDRALGRVWREVERGARRLLQALEPEDTGAGLVRAVQASRIRQQMRTVLQEAGYDALVAQATAEPFARLAETIIAAHPRLSALVAAPRLDALRALHELDLLDEGDRVASELWTAAARGLYARRSVSDILDDLAGIIDRTDAQIATLYDTAVSVFTRQVEVLDASDDPGARFLYTGPDDAKTREFCQARVNQVFTRAEIDAMDNGQIDNVLLSGGGYNCRHLWMQVSNV